MLFISKNTFWNFFDFIVLCSLLILGIFFYQQKKTIITIKQEIYNIKFQMKALHQDMLQMESEVFEKQYTTEKYMKKIEKDNRPEIHIHGNGDGSVKVYNVSGEIVVETVEGLGELEHKK
jgi:hypothetical protein